VTVCAVEVRPLTRAELDDAIKLGKAMHAESRFARLPFDVEKTRQYAAQIADNPAYIRLGAFLDGAAIGLAIGSVGQYHPFSSALIGSSYVLYVDPAHRRLRIVGGLIRGFIDAAKAMGASDIVIGTSTGYEAERVGNLFERFGGRHVGGVYAWEQ
jgi:hypothetical protein